MSIIVVFFAISDTVPESQNLFLISSKLKLTEISVYAICIVFFNSQVLIYHFRRVPPKYLNSLTNSHRDNCLLRR